MPTPSHLMPSAPPTGRQSRRPSLASTIISRGLEYSLHQRKQWNDCIIITSSHANGPYDSLQTATQYQPQMFSAFEPSAPFAPDNKTKPSQAQCVSGLFQLLNPNLFEGAHDTAHDPSTIKFKCTIRHANHLLLASICNFVSWRPGRQL